MGDEKKLLERKQFYSSQNDKKFNFDQPLVFCGATVFFSISKLYLLDIHFCDLVRMTKCARELLF